MNLHDIDPDDHLINSIYPDNDYNNSSKYYSLEHFNKIKIDPSKNSLLLNLNIRSFNKNGTSYEALLQSMDLKPSYIVMTETWNTSDSV